jgi:hypothetical protein
MEGEFDVFFVCVNPSLSYYGAVQRVTTNMPEWHAVTPAPFELFLGMLVRFAKSVPQHQEHVGESCDEKLSFTSLDDFTWLQEDNFTPGRVVSSVSSKTVYKIAEISKSECSVWCHGITRNNNSCSRLCPTDLLSLDMGSMVEVKTAEVKEWQTGVIASLDPFTVTVEVGGRELSPLSAVRTKPRTLCIGDRVTVWLPWSASWHCGVVHGVSGTNKRVDIITVDVEGVGRYSTAQRYVRYGRAADAMADNY